MKYKKRIAKPISSFKFIEKIFPNEDFARKYLKKIYWNGKPICPFCKQDKKDRIWKSPSEISLYKCKDCRKNFTITKGTIFESSKIPIRHWLYAFYLIMTARKGISSYQLAKELGITQKSAWFMKHRLRESCRNDNLPLLSEIIEMDETYIGGKEKNKHSNKRVSGTQGKSTKTKTAVVGMRTREGKVRAGKMEVINNATIQEKIDKNILKGSIICTDEARHYLGIRGYHHKLVNHNVGKFVKGMASTNGIGEYVGVAKKRLSWHFSSL